MMYRIFIRNKKTYKGNGIYIGRGSSLGNPFKIGIDGSREDVIEFYKYYFREEMVKSESTLKTEVYHLIDILKEQKKLNLICFCYPLKCHGEIIKHFLLSYMQHFNKPS